MRTTLRLDVFAGIALLALTVGAKAATECDSALIMSTYSRMDTYSQDYRLAKYVDQQTYTSAKQKYGATGSLFGISLGGSYSDYKDSYTRITTETHESLSTDEAHNIFWTGLDPNAANAYMTCIKAYFNNQTGLRAAVVAANKDNILVKVSWYNLNWRLGIKVQWVPPEAAKGVDTDIPFGNKTVKFQRPKTLTWVSANGLKPGGAGFSTEPIALTPLPKPVKPSCRPYPECKIPHISRWVSPPGSGGPWGDWRSQGTCPDGQFAYAVRIKVEPYQGGDDDTGMNAVRFKCRPPSSGFSAPGFPGTEINSGEGQWGEWSDWVGCPKGSFFSAYSLKVEPPQDGDDTAANNIKLQCTRYSDKASGNWVVPPRRSSWREWGDWRETGICPKGTFIVAFSSKVEPRQGSDDDTAMNDIKVLCRNY